MKVSIRRGYMALFTVLVLTFVLTVLGAAAGETGFFARMNTTDLENRVAATHLARSCAAIALLRSVQDAGFSVMAVGIDVSISELYTCHIELATHNGSLISVETTGHAGVSAARVMASGEFRESFRLTDWQEL